MNDDRNDGYKEAIRDFHRQLDACGYPKGTDGYLSRLKAKAAECDALRERAERAEAELSHVKAETIEYVHDGGDFNWVEAVVLIRGWREDAAQLAAVTAERDEAREELDVCRQEIRRYGGDQFEPLYVNIVRLGARIAELESAAARPLPPGHDWAFVRRLSEQWVGRLDEERYPHTVAQAKACLALLDAYQSASPRSQHVWTDGAPAIGQKREKCLFGWYRPPGRDAYYPFILLPDGTCTSPGHRSRIEASDFGDHFAVPYFESASPPAAAPAEQENEATYEPAPLGVMPRWLHREKRMEELHAAVMRAVQAKRPEFPPRQEWLDEYAELAAAAKGGTR